MYFDHCESPTELRKAISDLLPIVTFTVAELRGTTIIPIVGPLEDQTFRQTVLEARSVVQRLRKEHPDLPPLPDTTCLPLEGLMRLSAWCERADLKMGLRTDDVGFISAIGRKVAMQPPGSREMDEQDIQQIREYADRFAELLEPMAMPSLERTWESAGLDSTSGVAQRIAAEWDRVLHPLRVEYRKRVVAVLGDGWEPIADIFEHYAPQTLGRLDGWRRDILDHTDPGKDRHMYWLESCGEGHKQYGPNGLLRGVIQKFESKLRWEAERAEMTTGATGRIESHEDEVHYSLEEGFTGITDRNKAIWAKRYPHIKDFDKEVKETEEYLRQHPTEAEKVRSRARLYLDHCFVPESEWRPIGTQTAPQMPPETFAELAERMEMKLDLDRILSLHRKGFTVTPQEYANFRFDTDKLRKLDPDAGALPGLLGDPTADTVCLMEYCQEEAKRQLNVTKGAEDRGTQTQVHEQRSEPVESLQIPQLVEKLKALRTALDVKDSKPAHFARTDLISSVGDFSGIEDMLREFQCRCGSDAYKNKHIDVAIRKAADIRTGVAPRYDWFWDQEVATEGVIAELERGLALLSGTVSAPDEVNMASVSNQPVERVMDGKTAIEVSERMAAALEDWAHPKDEEGLRHKYVGFERPIRIALTGFDDLLNWLRFTRPDVAAVIQAVHDDFIKMAQLDDHLLDTFYNSDTVHSEDAAMDLADQLRAWITDDVSSTHATAETVDVFTDEGGKRPQQSMGVATTNEGSPERLNEDFSRPMPLTDIADRLFKDPRKWRKVKTLLAGNLRKVADKNWIVKLDGLAPNWRKELERL